MNQQQKYLVVLGSGESGVGAAILGKAKGYKVFVSDFGKIAAKYKSELNANSIDYEEQQHTESRILTASCIVKSPGIPETAPMVVKAREAGIEIVSEIEFASWFTNAYMVCITGSNGKTTTTLLIYDILKKAGLNVGLAGNVGKSFARQVATESFEYYVLELSSFQLDGMFSFKTNIGILMNITPDHLDRYDYDFEKYIASKFRIIQNMSPDDKLIFCQDDEVIIRKLRELNPNIDLLPFSILEPVNKGACVENGQLAVKDVNQEFTMDIQALSLQGKHNLYNSMAAAIAANVLKIKKESIRESLAAFEGVEHRLEKVIQVHRIEFINDSKATNVNSTWYALESMKKPTVWIVGGIDKGNDYSMLLPLVQEKVKGIVCLGVNNEPILKSFAQLGKKMVEARSMEEAVQAAYFMGTDGDAVLLSPACASFDLFDNYEDRGRQFKAAVRNL